MNEPKLIQFTNNGLYCPIADIYIDPWRPVDKAVISHAHADHARWGSKHYISHPDGEGILRQRLGEDISLQTLPYRKSLSINGVKISLHPAGHIIGSSQVRLEYKGEVWVFSGDYKLENDHFCVPFEPVKCNVFITESTFGLPIYKWIPQEEIFQQINSWWKHNQDNGKVSILFTYALGKAQRILHHLDHSIGKIFVHGAVWNVNEALKMNGAILPYVQRVTPETAREDFAGSMVIAPPSALGSPWLKKFKPFSTGMASGWMNLRGAKRRRAIDRGFILSDHADWPGLLQAVEGTGAQCIYATHGYTASFSRYLNEKGLEAHEVQTQYEGERAEITDVSSSDENQKEQ